jgi:hypothetical protein
MSASSRRQRTAAGQRKAKAIERLPSLATSFRNGTTLLCGVDMNEEIARRLAVAMAVSCVRNTSIEDIHAGIEPHSPSGDYSDVKVVTPVGEIPWPKVSRIRDDEMRAFMKQVVDRLYTVLLRLDDPPFVERIDQYARRMTRAWDAPKKVEDWFT